MRIRTFIKLFFPIIVLYIAFLWGLHFVSSSYFIVKTVNFSVQSSDTQLISDVEGELQQALIGQNIWFIPTSHLQNMLEKDVRINRVAIKKEFPNTVTINFITQIPIGYALFTNSKNWYAFDQNGDIIGAQSSFPNLQLLKYKVGNISELKKTIGIINNIPSSYQIQIQEVDSLPGEVDIIFTNGLIIKTDAKVKAEKYDIALKLYEKLTSQNTKVSYIDIRFKNYAVKEN
ncbi:MAG: FtsQ-type POTRA domain-containing protein [Fusobacteria bacterium]|nr:FtsQ-type POTRA domain-containing protein [Fusobacteriota bacterium]